MNLISFSINCWDIAITNRWIRYDPTITLLVFSWSPIVKFWFIVSQYHLLWLFINQRKFPGDFMKTSGETWEISRKYSGILPTGPPQPPYPHWNFKFVFLDNRNGTKFTIYFPPPSFVIWTFGPNVFTFSSELQVLK